jgi:hypothetical protein
MNFRLSDIHACMRFASFLSGTMIISQDESLQVVVVVVAVQQKQKHYLPIL